MIQDSKYIAKAFVSCSLREEDKQFVDFVCQILEKYKILPFGTVGKFSASPENPAVLMKKNINQADFIVICATPRYSQKDLKTGKESIGLSEMVHVETGMAFAQNKPVVVFVKEGTHIGSFIPNITQYIKLDAKEEDFSKNKILIKSVLKKACVYVENEKETNFIQSIFKTIIIGLAFYGILKLFSK